MLDFELEHVFFTRALCQLLMMFLPLLLPLLLLLLSLLLWLLAIVLNELACYDATPSQLF